MAVSLAEKVQVVERLEAGESWRTALDKVGVQASESSVYLWRQKWRRGGQAALVDGRYGRRHKLNDELRSWLTSDCEAAPASTSGELQAALAQRFGVAVSRGHINLLRAQCGMSRSPKKRRG
jgi:transposase